MEGTFRKVFCKHRQMPYRPHAVISLTNDVLVELVQGTALFIAAWNGVDVKFFGNDGPNVLNK